MELEFLSGLASTRRPADSIRTQTVNAAGPAVSKPYSSLEVELTTRCNLYCPSCARVVHSRTWIERDMTLDCYREIAKSFDRFELVHLRGWGEPLKNPHFSEMVGLSMRHDIRLVLSTNGGIRLDPDLLPCFDTIFYRLDYGRASTYERRNPRARFNRAIFNISEVLRRRESMSGQNPEWLSCFPKTSIPFSNCPFT